MKKKIIQLLIDVTIIVILSITLYNLHQQDKKIKEIQQIIIENNMNQYEKP